MSWSFGVQKWVTSRSSSRRVFGSNNNNLDNNSSKNVLSVIALIASFTGVWVSEEKEEKIIQNYFCKQNY